MKISIDLKIKKVNSTWYKIPIELDKYSILEAKSIHIMREKEGKGDWYVYYSENEQDSTHKPIHGIGGFNTSFRLLKTAKTFAMDFAKYILAKGTLPEPRSFDKKYKVLDYGEDY